MAQAAAAWRSVGWSPTRMQLAGFSCQAVMSSCNMPGPGLRLGVGAAVGLERGVWVGGAVAEVVDRAAAGANLVDHPGGKTGELGFVVVAAGDAGLVGDDEDVPAGVGGGAHGVDGAGDEYESFLMADPAVIDVDDAVAVEEEGAAMEAGGELGLGAFEVGGDADVDEIAVADRGADGPLGDEGGEHVAL